MKFQFQVATFDFSEFFVKNFSNYHVNKGEFYLFDQISQDFSVPFFEQHAVLQAEVCTVLSLKNEAKITELLILLLLHVNLHVVVSFFCNYRQVQRVGKNKKVFWP